MGMGRTGQTLGVVVCVGGLVWAGFALGKVTGVREGRGEVEARWAHARAVTEAERNAPPPAPEPNAIARVVAPMAGARCVDAGPSEMGAPHFCRWGQDGAVGTAIHWWGPAIRPTRSYVVYFLGSGMNDTNAAGAVDAMYLSAISLANSFGPPEGFFARINAASPEANFRSGDVTVTVREHRITPNLPPMFVGVDLTAGD